MTEHKTLKRAAEGAATLAMTFPGKIGLSEVALRDAILKKALELQRLSAGQEQAAAKILSELEQELKALLESQTLSEAGKAEINALIREADQAISPAYDAIAASTDTHAIAVVVAERTVQALDAILPSDITAPTAERLASLTKDVLIDGAPSSAWWEKQAEDLAFKFAAAVRQGVVNGETNEKIVARVTAKDGTGILDIAKRNARTLVHSSVMSAANDARLATYRKNANLLEGVRFLATLDSHTCIVCAAHDGATWDLDGKPIDGTKLSFDPPPLHFSCRCVLSPLPKAIEGLNLPEGTRASAVGPVPATTTFSDFLKRNREFADKILGAKRAELFLSGKLTLTDLITGGGKVLSLDEL
jgi:SPP1 gp7 family putative phage head morphogenesis protein